MNMANERRNGRIDQKRLGLRKNVSSTFWHDDNGKENVALMWAKRPGNELGFGRHGGKGERGGRWG